ncbi:MAG: helicase HerA domain-containing protein [Natronomonas sp.]
MDETITVGEVSRGSAAGRTVDLPIVDLLTGRGFITGKSGSGKSNSASVVAENLLDRGYSLLAVDIDGEYYGLKEEYEILHVGGDDECDLRVGVEHAEKIAELALEQNVPIILDVSSFLEESKAREILYSVTKHLFAKEKKRKQPFLMLVEEVHEYIPEGGGMDECGRMLIKVGKRGRKHGLGIVGISQRPADVKKDFITQCDWLVWHRLTWKNDTSVVANILGSEYGDYVEELEDGECFLRTDWFDDVRPVQFDRKRTFDAGATPGLEDFERPDLKSVSGDLVEELTSITERQHERENHISELERKLEQKDERIDDLERQLADARDLKRMADRFTRAMTTKASGRPGGTGPNSDPTGDGVGVHRNGDRTYRESGTPDGRTDPEPSLPSGSNGHVSASNTDDVRRDRLVARISTEIDLLSTVERRLLCHYRDTDVATPLRAFDAVGGEGGRNHAYAANRALRTSGFIDHVGKGYYAYALPDLIADEISDGFGRDIGPDDPGFDALVREIERKFVDPTHEPNAAPEYSEPNDGGHVGLDWLESVDV